MGDSTWVDITIYKKDYDKVIEVLGEPEEVNSDHSNKLLKLFYYEYNYAAYNELNSLAVQGVKFHGAHGNGGSYNAYCFVSNGKYFHEIRSDNESNPVVRCAPGGPDKDEVEIAMTYYKLFEQFEDAV